MKLAGTALILLGSLGVFLRYTGAQRREMALLRDLIAALECLAGSIRWKKLPLPEGIREQADRAISGKYFCQVANNLTGANTLQESWNGVFCRILPEAAEILCRMEWQGDLQQIQGSLCHCAEQLSRLLERREATLRQREKLCGAAALSVAGVLVILLM